MHAAGASAAVFFVVVSIIQRLSTACELYVAEFDAMQFDIKPVNRHRVSHSSFLKSHTPACTKVGKRHTIVQINANIFCVSLN